MFSQVIEAGEDQPRCPPPASHLTFNHQHADEITLKDICTFHLPFFVIKGRRYGNEGKGGLRWSLNKQAKWLMNDASLLTRGLLINIHYAATCPAVS